MENDQIYIFRRCVTGASDYHFYYRGKLLMTAVELVVPGFPVFLNWGNRQLEYRRNMEQTIVPGIFNLLCSEDREYARVIFRNFEKQELRIGDACIEAISTADGYYFVWKGRPTAILRSVTQKTGFGPEWELWKVMHLLQDIPQEHLLLTMSFPLLAI